MKSLLLLAILAAPALAADVKPVFVPMAAFYMDGKLTEVKIVGDPYNEMRECLDDFQKQIGVATAQGKMPKGGRIVGVCVPVKPSLHQEPSAEL